MLGEEISNNPEHRCMYCKGREVIRQGLHGPYSNLQFIPTHKKQGSWKIEGLYRCIDKIECQMNIEAESTEIEWLTNEDADEILGFRVFKMGELILEAIYNDDFNGTADF